MFSSMKMTEYMKSELSGIFQGKLLIKSMLLGTHFMHMRVKNIHQKLDLNISQSIKETG